MDPQLQDILILGGCLIAGFVCIFTYTYKNLAKKSSKNKKLSKKKKREMMKR